MDTHHDTAPTVGVVGAGRVGAALGAALRRAGWPVTAVSARSADSIHRAADLLPDVAVAAPTEVAAQCRLLMLAVPDDVLSDVVDDLAGRAAVSTGQYVVHTSGVHGAGALSALANLGAHGIAMHPTMTFTGTAADLDRLPGCAYGVTCTDQDLPMAESVVSALAGYLSRIPEADRPLYHAALAHGANHLVTLVAESMDLLRLAGVEEPARSLRPLLTAALDYTLDAGDEALTGPVARGDTGTVQAHVDRLAQVAPGQLPSYLAMARATVDRAVAAGRLDGESGAALVAQLDEACGKATAWK